MSKAILVLDMPDACQKCPCFQGYDILNAYCGTEADGRYGLLSEYFDDKKGWIRPDWCPLKELPEKEINSGSPYDEYGDGYTDGWNDCLDMILGE